MYLKVLIPERINTQNPMILATKAIELLEKGDMVTFCFDELDDGVGDMLQKDRAGIWYFDGYQECMTKPACDNDAFCKGKMKFHRDDGKSFFKCMLYYLPGAMKCPIKFVHKMNYQLEDSLFEL
jgi:hypothetical protein